MLADIWIGLACAYGIWVMYFYGMQGMKKNKYRVTQKGPEDFVIERRIFLLGWRDVSTPDFTFPYSGWKPITSLLEAKEIVKKWESHQQTYPIHYYL